MFCPHCGSQIDDGSVFCPNCGSKIEGAESPAAGAAPAPAVAAGQPRISASKGKKLPVKGIAIAAAALVVLIVIVVAAANRKTTVKLDNYVSVSFDGYEGYGKAIADFDEDRFVKDYKDKIKLSKSAQRQIQKSMDEFDFFDELGGYLGDYIGEEADPSYLLYSTVVNGSLDKSSELKNGDKVVWEWDIEDEEIADYFNVKLKYKDISFKVEGLEEIAVFDAFDGVEVVFSGVAPNGNAHIDAKPKDNTASYLNYEIDRTSGLSNGDKVVVTLSAYGRDIREYCAEKFGRVPAETEKEYICDGLSAYAASASDIPKDILEKMQKQGEDVFRAYVAKEWNADTATLDTLKYIGNYFMTRKAGVSGGSDQNIVYMIYQADATVDYTNSDGDRYKDKVTNYYYVRFHDVMIMSDGSGTVDLSNYSVTSDSYEVDSGVVSSWWNTYKWRFYGYQNLDTMFNKLVTSYIDKYEYEDNIG